MALSVFDDRSSPPGHEELAAALGKSLRLWNDLVSRVEARFGPVTAEWGFASKSTGWGLRLKGEKRTVLYMTPQTGHFIASFALGEKAVAAARAGGLAVTVLEAIDRAPKYAEGRGVRLDVRTVTDVLEIEKLATIKMST